MRFKYLIICIQIVLACQTGFCQKNGTDKEQQILDDAKVNPTNLAKSQFEINDIKTKGVIVRIKTSRDRIAAYRKAGYKDVADKLEYKTKTTNLLLLHAFLTQWTYSPVYFMESEYTLTLMRNDTLIAKTYDLRRDTSIYLNHDSFYVVDFGEELMSNDADDKHPLKYTNVSSNNPVPGNYLVVKDHSQSQLQPPMPCNAKVWLDEFTNTDKMTGSIEIPAELNDSMIYYVNKYNTFNELMKSEAKSPSKRFLDSLYYHINFETKKPGNSSQSFAKLGAKQDAAALGFSMPGVELVFVKGNPYQSAAKRLNKSFIAYYCKRLDKDKNILCNDDPYYWWQKNPNIRYLPYLLALESELKESSGKNPKLMK